MNTLKQNSNLQGGKYKILNTLGQGGFGITYLAIQSGLERKVAIKEFYIKELCERDESTSHVTLGTEESRETVSRFREKFLKEARNIAKLNHPNIVRIIDVFEENGTAYYVMEYAENGSLADKVKRECYLSESVATRYILQVASALEYIHQQKMNHLDVKPANIMLNEKNEAILIDFGLSKQYDAVTGSQTSTTPVVISHGYAPMEQYREGGVGEFSPETDIYALGATFFKLLSGNTPPSASDIYEDGVPVKELKTKGVSQNATDIICKAMESRRKARINEISIFVNGLASVDNNQIKKRKCIDNNEKFTATSGTESLSLFGWDESLHNLIWIYDGKMYRFSYDFLLNELDSNKIEDYFIGNVSIKSYLSQHDSFLSRCFILYNIEKSNYLDALEILSNNNRVYIFDEDCMSAFGSSIPFAHDERILKICHNKSCVSMEVSTGMFEYLGDFNTNFANNIPGSFSYITIQLNHKEFILNIIKGCFLYFRLLNRLEIGDESQYVFLSTFSHDINIIKKHHGVVREFIPIIEKDITVPCRKSSDIYVDESVIYIQLCEREIGIPTFLYENKNMINLAIDISSANLITIIINDVINKIEKKYSLIELLQNENTIVI